MHLRRSLSGNWGIKSRLRKRVLQQICCRKANGARNVNAKVAPAVNNRQPSPPIARSDATFTASKDTAAEVTDFLMQKRSQAPHL
jgi:hypothetical protein